NTAAVDPAATLVNTIWLLVVVSPASNLATGVPAGPNICNFAEGVFLPMPTLTAATFAVCKEPITIVSDCATLAPVPIAIDLIPDARAPGILLVVLAAPRAIELSPDARAPLLAPTGLPIAMAF